MICPKSSKQIKKCLYKFLLFFWVSGLLPEMFFVKKVLKCNNAILKTKSGYLIYFLKTLDIFELSVSLRRNTKELSFCHKL